MRAATPRRVMHCDLDAFFASVEELDDPSLRGKPLIVGGSPTGRGVVSTANYVARRYGVHSAMAASIAYRRCPQAVFLRPRFDRYRELSHAVMAIVDEYFQVREQVSIDEAYCEHERPGLEAEPSETLGARLRERVRRETGLAISVGIASSKSLAKLASDLRKPDALVVVAPGDELHFLAPLPLGKLSGVGPHTETRLKHMGLHTVGQLAGAPLSWLEARLGKHGVWLWQLANAQDDRPVVADHGPPKSISSEDTFSRDISSLDQLRQHVRDQAAHVARRCHAKEVIGRTVTLKIRWSDFSTITRQRSLPAATADLDTITALALEIFEAEIARAVEAGRAVRLLGVGIHGISEQVPQAAPEAVTQLPLFPATA